MSSTPSEPTPAPQYEQYNPQSPTANPNGYQPLYNQPTYQQPYPAQPYQQYPPQQYQPYPAQPYQGQPPYQAPQYGTGNQYQTAYVVTPTTTYCVEETHCKTTSSGTGIGWILFIIGFFFPICWLVGAFFLCSSNHSDRRAGRANLVGFICVITFLTIFFITTQ